jgi:hypothetical protein
MLTLAACTLFGTGCEARPSPQTPANPAQVEADVRALLDRWVQSFESRDEHAIRSVLVDDDRFTWLEDGEVRYQSPDDVVAALASFPPGLEFTHELTSVRIVPVTDTAAWAQIVSATQIRQSEQVVSDFNSVVLMLVQRDESEWRIVAAHTSSARP